jgi:hypothetical protein
MTEDAIAKRYGALSLIGFADTTCKRAICRCDCGVG